MNLRFEILRAVSKNPGAPMTEICDAIDHDSQKVKWSVIDCKKSGLLEMARDDVTGQPGYHLTEAGKARLAEGAATKQGNNLKNVQPVTKNTGSSASALPSLSAEGAAVQPEPAPEVPADVSTAAPVAVDEPTETDHKLLEQGVMIMDLTQAVSDLRQQLDVAEAELAHERIARAALQEQVEELQRDAMRGASLLSGDDRYTAACYLVRAPKRPMRIFSKAEAAQAAAMAAARNGSGRGEVFALVPAGRAVRGAEWRAQV